MTKSAFTTTATGDRLDWSEIKDRVDLGVVATSLLGPAPGRRGQKGRRLWWHCPFHEDQNPSFSVDIQKGWWKCYGCDAHGDAPDLVMRLQSFTFPEAVRYLAGDQPPNRGPTRGPAPAPARQPAPEQPSGVPLAVALALVVDAERRLWTSEGEAALEQLRARGLEDEVIKAARLGFTPGIAIPKKDGSGTWNAKGITIPWFDRDRLALVKIRQPSGREPKYGEAFRDRPGLYPAPASVRPGKPLVICEGEFDALLLAQELADFGAGVVTLGAASNHPAGAVLDLMLSSPVWWLALDADDAGDKSAAKWPARARRVKPPRKDWGEVHKAGFNLLRYIWGGILRQPSIPWEVLEAQRWPVSDNQEVEDAS
jgi:CHC2 zinc finger/Toprim-like